MMPGGKFGLTNGVGIPPVFCVSADKSLNFRLKHFTPIPKANDSEKTVMNSSSSVLPHYAKRDYDYHYFSSKQQNAKLFTLSCEMKDRLLLQQHHFILCYAGWCSTAPHSHLMVHRVVMKLWFVIFLQLHCCKTCRILTAQRSVALGLEFVAWSLWIRKGTKNWLDWLYSRFSSKEAGFSR